MLSDPEAYYDLIHNPIMKKIFGNEPFFKYDYNTFKNFIDKEMKMMMRQLSESKPQNSNKKNKKKNFSD